jgi:hypothetical protein
MGGGQAVWPVFAGIRTVLISGKSELDSHSVNFSEIHFGVGGNLGFEMTIIPGTGWGFYVFGRMPFFIDLWTVYSWEKLTAIKFTSYNTAYYVDRKSGSCFTLNAEMEFMLGFGYRGFMRKASK